MKLNLPNIFSLLRVVLAPVFAMLLLSRNQALVLLSAGVFAVAAITDYFDGFFARRFKAVSSWGVFLDPLADKVLTAFAFTGLALLSYIEWWMVAIVLARDVLMTLLRLYADMVRQPVKTSWSAKVKTFLQMVFISYVLLMDLFVTVDIFSPLRFVGQIGLSHIGLYSAMLAITLLTVWTAVEYFFDNRTLITRLWRYETKA